MTTFPTVNPDRIVAWARRHGLNPSKEKHIVCPLEGFEEPLRIFTIASEDNRDLIVALYFPFALSDGNADLGLSQASAEEAQTLLNERAMGDWGPRELYEAAEKENPAYINTLTHLYLGEGATDTQLDEGICDALDAIFAAMAFHPSVVLAAADASVNAAGEPKPITWKLLDYRREHASAAPAQSVTNTDNSGRNPWWDIDQEKAGKGVTAQRLVNILRWYDAEISCEKRGENDVIILRRKGMSLEVKVSPQGRISVAYQRELTTMEADNPRLKEYLEERASDYGFVRMGIRKHDTGMTLRFECWQPAMRVSEGQIDAFFAAALKGIRECVDYVDQALCPVQSEDNGE